MHFDIKKWELVDKIWTSSKLCWNRAMAMRRRSQSSFTMYSSRVTSHHIIWKEHFVSHSITGAHHRHKFYRDEIFSRRLSSCRKPILLVLSYIEFNWWARVRVLSWPKGRTCWNLWIQLNVYFWKCKYFQSWSQCNRFWCSFRLG